MHDEFYSLTGKLKNVLKSLYEFSFVGGRVRLHVGNTAAKRNAHEHKI